MTMSMRRKCLLAVLVTAFVALYPYFGAMDMCDAGACPMAVHSVGFSAVCLIVALAAVPRIRAVSELRLRYQAHESRPLQVFSSPDPPPPRLSPAR
jgi:hypothetical protein